jgi:dolichyl-phosphate-mannose-protein mannosyltransferase
LQDSFLVQPPRLNGMVCGFSWQPMRSGYPLAGVQLLQYLIRSSLHLPRPALPWPARSLGEQLGRLNPIAIFLGLVIAPALFYYWIWMPHLLQNPNETFIELQKKIFTYHQGSTVIGNVHPYCSTWTTWLAMSYPVVYFYRRGIDPHQILLPNPSVPDLPTAPIYDVHSMGNPALWWLSTLAIGLTLSIVLLQACFKGFDTLQVLATEPHHTATHHAEPHHGISQGSSPKAPLTDLPASPTSLPFYARLLTLKPLSPDSWIAIYIVVNYLVNLLPWTRISRCAFLYHYMGSLVFATIALAWWFDRALQTRNPDLKIGVQVLLGLITLAFIWWMPVYLGLPLDETGYRLRMWFDTWICGIRCPK